MGSMWRLAVVQAFLIAAGALMSAGVLAQDKSIGASTSGKRLALVIGNDDYQNVSKLEKAGNDAVAIARELKAAGFEVTMERDLNYRNMVKKVDFFTSHIGGGDQVVVFFAGHGVQLKTGSYLLPTDIEANSESEIEKTAVSLNDVLDRLNEARASFALVMIDACRDNPLKSNGRALGGGRGLSAVEPPKGQMVVYSASKGQQALDKLNKKDNDPNGVFTREFIARMKKPGVRIEDMVREVQDSVEDLARSIGHDQRPAIYNEARGNFYFYGPVTVLAPQPYDRPAPTTQPPTKATAPVSADPETEFWGEVKNRGTRSFYDAYLKQYPKGKYAALAKLELKGLDELALARKAREKAEHDEAAEQLKAMKAQASFDEEADYWQRAQGGGKAEVAAYLKRYPNGKYALAANQRMSQLNREQPQKEVGGIPTSIDLKGSW